MTLQLEDTTAGEVNRAISAERNRLGGSASGMVLTLVIVTDEHNQSEASRAATFSANQHPCRILVVIPRPGGRKHHLDAEIIVGEREGPGELVKLRLKGPLANQPQSVVLPLLLPDTPVVAWWPGTSPAIPADDPVGQLAQRRITDATASRRPMAELATRIDSYREGDTDLAWTRTTPWRSMLATALDEPFDPIRFARVGAQKGNPSGPLLAAWLRARLKVPVTLVNTRGPGITEVQLTTKTGEIGISRPDGHLASLSRPNLPERRISLPRRELRDLVSEELRRLDADEIYAQALESLDFEVVSAAKAKEDAAAQAGKTKFSKSRSATPTPSTTPPPSATTAETEVVAKPGTVSVPTAKPTKTVPAKAVPKKLGAAARKASVAKKTPMPHKAQVRNRSGVAPKSGPAKSPSRKKAGS